MIRLPYSDLRRKFHNPQLDTVCLGLPEFDAYCARICAMILTVSRTSWSWTRVEKSRAFPGIY